MASVEPPPSDPPKERKLLFKRTVPRKKPEEQKSPEVTTDANPEDETNDLDFFRRSKDVFPRVLQEVLEENSPSPEKHDRKRRKLSAESETKRTVARNSSPVTSGTPERRKSSVIALESDSDSDLIMDIKGKGKEVTKPAKFSTPRKPAMGSNKSSPRITKVDDDDDDDEYEPRATPSRRGQTERVTRGSSRLLNRNSSPVELADSGYIKTETGTGNSSDLEEIQPPSDEDPLDEELSAWVAKAQQRQAIPNPDVRIKILITSRIPGTRPLVVERRLQQNFQVALDTWIVSQRGVENFSISEQDTSQMFLTWRGNKIYGHSTLASLGIQVNDRGEVKGIGNGFRKTGIHLEAWTDEDYSLYLENKRAKLADSNEEEDAGLEDLSAPPPPKKRGIRVTLKAKAFDSLNITVHDDTTIKTVIEAFRSQRKVDPERKVEIWFDGERLDDNSLVTDADIDPDETNQLEVHVK